MRTIPLTPSESVPALGLGSWRMGENARARPAELAAVRRAVELGYRLFDTAEMYGEGGAERVLGQALGDALRTGGLRRDELFIVSKVYPHNASRQGVAKACESSLERLGLERIDLYLLHWPGSHPLAQTVEAFEDLVQRGRIRHWGVSNFDADAMAELWALPAGKKCVTNQVYYSLGKRGIEFDLVPWQREHGVTTMAYCPIDQGTLSYSKALGPIAQRLNATPAQVALAWLISRGDVIAIPKAVQEAHLRENFAAASLQLDAVSIAELETVFPPPRRKQPLAMS